MPNRKGSHHENSRRIQRCQGRERRSHQKTALQTSRIAGGRNVQRTPKQHFFHQLQTGTESRIVWSRVERSCNEQAESFARRKRLPIRAALQDHHHQKIRFSEGRTHLH